MTIRRFTKTITVDPDGDAEVFIGPVNGALESISYVKDDFENGVDFVVTLEESGTTLWSEEAVNASAQRRPRAATHSTAGAPALYASGGAAVLDRIMIDSERIKIVVADGGNAKSGTIHVLIDG